MNRTATKQELNILNREHQEFSKREPEIRDLIKKLVAMEPLVEVRGDVDTPFGKYNISGVYIQWNAGWGCECTVYVHFTDEAISTAEGDVTLRKLACEVSWSSTSRTVPQAVSAVHVYSRAIDFAATLESVFCNEMWIRD